MNVAESTSSIKMSIEEKKKLLDDINMKIQALIDEIKEINREIYLIKGEITNFMNANRLYDYLNDVSKGNRELNCDAIDDKAVLNDEHIEILKNKQNSIAVLENASNELFIEQKVLENRLASLRSDFYETSSELLENKELSRRLSSECYMINMDIKSLNDQDSEISSELRIKEQTRRDSEKALQKLNEKTSLLMNSEGGHLDLEKMVSSLQQQVLGLDSDISKANQRIAHAKHESLELSEKDLMELSYHQSTVDWTREKKELKDELQKLNEEIKEKKTGVQAQEKSTSADLGLIEKYSPLLKKWADQLHTTRTPKDSIATLDNNLEKSAKTKEKQKKALERELVEVISLNQRHTKELEKKRALLDRIVTQFHADEALSQKNLQDKRQCLIEEQCALKAKIAEAKLRQAQKYVKPK